MRVKGPQQRVQVFRDGLRKSVLILMATTVGLSRVQRAKRWAGRRAGSVLMTYCVNSGGHRGVLESLVQVTYSRHQILWGHDFIDGYPPLYMVR